MKKEQFSEPVSLQKIRITDIFWKQKMEMIRTEVIPYQWKALNDQIEGAAPSFCMHNFRAAAKKNQRKEEMEMAGEAVEEPVFHDRGFEVWPEDLQHPDDRFYGFVFQDSDFYKWIEAVAYSLIQHPDEELEKKADAAVEIVCAAQQENGYLDTYYILNGMDHIFTNLQDYHELYCLGHLLEGAVAYYQATGKNRLLMAAKRYADFVTDIFGYEEGKCKGYPGHEIIEMALIRLYGIFPEQKYLDLASFFLEMRGREPNYFKLEHPEKDGQNGLEHYQAHLPVREQTEAAGHAVRAVYLYSGMADVARETKDDTMLEACERLWNNITRRRMYITGGIGSTNRTEAFSYDYDLPNDSAYSETCASIGLIFFARRMLQIRPWAGYADVMERALYNCVMAGIALDGKSFFYVNPLEVNPEACKKDKRLFHVKPVRQKWFGCACCPPNLARLITSLGSYVCTKNDDTLYLHLYIGSEIRLKKENGEMCFEVSSDMPWGGHVCITMTGESGEMTLAVRIPEWCRGQYQRKGAEDAACKEKDGYLYITKLWRKGDRVSLDFEMKIQMLRANSRVREDCGKVVLLRGPVAYCLEGIDNGTDLHLLSVGELSQMRTEPFMVCTERVTSILARGYRREATKDENQLYFSWEREMQQEVLLRFIPYYVWGNRGETEMSVWIRKD